MYQKNLTENRNEIKFNFVIFVYLHYFVKSYLENSFFEKSHCISIQLLQHENDAISVDSAKSVEFSTWLCFSLSNQQLLASLVNSSSLEDCNSTDFSNKFETERKAEEQCSWENLINIIWNGGKIKV